jgi:HemY protein
MQASAETCAELARLLFSLGEREKSAQYYREGLLLRETELPDLPLPSMEQPRSVRAS